jgi:hypothetical protein
MFGASNERLFIFLQAKKIQIEPEPPKGLRNLPTSAKTIGSFDYNSERC